MITEMGPERDALLLSELNANEALICANVGGFYRAAKLIYGAFFFCVSYE